MGGTPFTLRCPKCKVLRRHGETYSAEHIVPTGRKRQNVKRPGVGIGEQAEVVHSNENGHRGCGHKWWTFHPRFTKNAPIRLGPGA